MSGEDADSGMRYDQEGQDKPVGSVPAGQADAKEASVGQDKPVQPQSQTGGQDKHDELTVHEIAALAEARARKAAEAAAEAKAAAEENALQEYKEAAKEAAVAAKDSKFTNKRAGEVIFRREMGEPEFWLTKEGLIPPRPMLTSEEEKTISQSVEIPADGIPKYNPEYILSPEYGGMSSYENGIDTYMDQMMQRLTRLKEDPEENREEISRVERDMAKMETLYENYHIGMNVFRTAKGGRDKIK